MSYKQNKIRITIAAIAALLVLAPGYAVAQYNVSGVVDFSYRDFETKTGNSKVVISYFTQDYQAQLVTPIYDPRMLIVSGGVGYQIISANDNNPDSTILNYNLSAAFFTGMKFSWDLFANKTTDNISAPNSVGSYDVRADSYGGSVRMNLSKFLMNGNNQNITGNENNNAGNRSSFQMPLPDISLSYNRNKVESESLLNPLQETRDIGSFVVFFPVFAGIKLDLDGNVEKYEDLLHNRSYEIKTEHAISRVNVTRDGELTLDATLTDRTTNNITFFPTEEKVAFYKANLDFREREGWLHYYHFTDSTDKTNQFEYDQRTLDTRIRRKLLEYLYAEIGVNYRYASFYQNPTAVVIGLTSEVTTLGLLGGVDYMRTYTPSFLGPFAFRTHYEFTTGTNSFSTDSPTATALNGRGLYYKNSVDLGLASNGWQQETLNMGGYYSSQRDNSPLQNDVLDEGFLLNLISRRIPKSLLRATVQYDYFNGSNAAGSVFLNTTGPALNGSNLTTTLTRHTSRYDISLEHYLTNVVTITEGATKGNADVKNYTLFNLQTPSTASTNHDFYAYGSVAFNNQWTYNLSSRLEFREEYRSSTSDGIKSHIANFNLNYRIRQILASLEYRFREDVPNTSQRTDQYSFFAKVSRPF